MLLHMVHDVDTELVYSNIVPVYQLFVLTLSCDFMYIGNSPFAFCQLPRGVHTVSIRATNSAKLRSTLRFSFTLH